MTTVARYVVLAALFLIPFLPLYVANDLLFPFISSKGFAFRILIGFAAGAYLLLALADKRYRPRFSWTLLIYGAFVAWMFLADLLAPNAHKAFWSNYERMDGWVTMIHVFLFFIVAGSVLTVEKLWKRWWLTFAGASALIAGYGVLQLMGALTIHQGGVRLDASFGNAAYLAAYLLSAIAISLWQGIESKGWLRYALLILAGVQSILLFQTATRGAILAFVGASVLASLLFALRSKESRKIGLGFLIGIVVIIGGFLALKDTSFVREDPVLTRVASISVADGDTRFMLWGMAAKGFMERPITGWGHEGFNFVFAKHYDPALYAQEPWFDRAHSVYVDWLMAGGLPALLLFLALLISAVVALYRSNASASERILLTSALAAYAFQALFVFDNLFTYVVLAALLAMAHAERSRPIPQLEKLPQAELTIAAPAVAVITLVVVWVVNVPGIMGGQALIRGLSSPDPVQGLSEMKAAVASGTFSMQEIREHFLTYASEMSRQSSVANAVKQEALSLALQEMQKEIERMPNDPRLRIQFASGLEAGGLLQEALTEMEAAIVLSPQKQLTYVQRGVMQWRAGNRPAALADFEAAYAIDTSFSDLAAYVAGGRITTGDIAGGRAFLVERFGTTTVDQMFLRAAFYEAKMYPELVASSELAVTNNPNDPQAYFALAQAYALSGRVAEARAAAQLMATRFPQTEAAANQFLQQLGK